MTKSEAAIEVDSPEFARRLAKLLRSTRKRRGMSRRALATASNGRFTKSELRQLEAGTLILDESILEASSATYGADLGVILPARLPVVVTGATITAGGVEATFTPHDSTSLLTAYLRLIRLLRRHKQAPAIVLRRDDIDALASYLDESGEHVVDRLGALMGAAGSQRRAMATMFASGAIVIGLVGGGVAASTARSSSRGGGVAVVSVIAPAPTDAGSDAERPAPVTSAEPARPADAFTAAPHDAAPPAPAPLAPLAPPRTGRPAAIPAPAPPPAPSPAPAPPSAPTEVVSAVDPATDPATDPGDTASLMEPVIGEPLTISRAEYDAATTPEPGSAPAPAPDPLPDGPSTGPGIDE